jgi:hypothetical protein
LVTDKQRSSGLIVGPITSPRFIERNGGTAARLWERASMYLRRDLSPVNASSTWRPCSFCVLVLLLGTEDALLLYSSITGGFIITCRRLSLRLFSRQETPSLSIPTLSAAFLVRTFVANSVPPRAELRRTQVLIGGQLQTCDDSLKVGRHWGVGGGSQSLRPSWISSFGHRKLEHRSDSFGEAQNRCVYPGEEMKPRRRLISNRRRSITSRSSGVITNL